jgi:GT2 family glycosyltransferase
MAALIHTCAGVPVAPQNRWDLIPVTTPDTPHLRASVIIPARNGSADLARTLTALAASDYPRELLEVIVVDDHSDPPLDPPEQFAGLSIRCIPNRPHQVFGAGIARCTGAASSSADVLVFLDADIVCDRDLISRHMAWHHRVPYALVSDEILFADVGSLTENEFALAVGEGTVAGLLCDRVFEGQQWRRNHFVRSRFHTVDAPDLFRSTVGALLSVHRSTYEAIGGFRELGIRGIEDLEFGYRSHNAGALLIADTGAHCWHQGPRTMSANRAQILAERTPVMEDLIPVPGFRSDPKMSAPSVSLLDWTVRDSAESTAASERVARVITEMIAPAADIAWRQVAVAPTLIGVRSAGWMAPDRAETRIAQWMLDHQIGVLHLLDVATRTEVATVIRTRAIGRALLAGITDPTEALLAAGNLFGERWVTVEEAGMRHSGTPDA